MAYGTHTHKHFTGQEIGRALRTPVKSEALYIQMLGRIERPRNRVVYDGKTHHYVPSNSFWSGPVVSEWIVP